jgi:sn-glycerol 3-phosphate transport system substrate-binding protein
MFSLKHVVAATCTALACTSVYAQTQIQFWHAMTGANNDRVVSLADRFNKSQSTYKVVPVYKGGYDDTMAAAIAATRAGNAPHIVQIFEAGTATMMAAVGDETAKRKKGVVKPIYQMMAEAGVKFDPKIYVPAVRDYYTDTAGRMLSFPFNSSTTVFYYNKDAFKKAGLDPNVPPKTWPEVQVAAQKIKDSNASACPYTTAWQAWVQLENFHAWHNLPYATLQNGFGGLKTELVFNDMLTVRHIALLSAWAKAGLFVYPGRTTEGDGKFYSGDCAMYSGSSATYGNIVKNAKFEFGVSKLPYYDDVKGAPQNTIIGGASLWVMAGKKPAEYKGIAQFFAFLSKPELAAEWHQGTGYLPITMAAYELTKKQGFYEKNPGTDISVQQMTGKVPTPNSKGVRLGYMPQIRTAIDEELEAVWAGKKAPKEALDEAVKRGNELLRKFEQANK